MKNLNLVNEYIANAVVLNAKLHNFHFNVSGPQFVPAHEYLESLYNKFFSYYDEVAEQVKIQGEEPMVRLSDYLKIASIKEVESRQFEVSEVYKVVAEDLKAMQKLALSIRQSADEEDNFLLANLMEDHIEYYAKQLWFIRASLA